MPWLEFRSSHEPTGSNPFRVVAAPQWTKRAFRRGAVRRERVRLPAADDRAMMTQLVGPATTSLTRDGWSESLKRFAEVRPFRLPISRLVRPSRKDAAGIHIAEKTGLRSSVHGGLPIGDSFAALLELPAQDRLTCVERTEHAAGAVNNQRATEWPAPRFRGERVRVHREPSDGAAIGRNPCIAK